MRITVRLDDDVLDALMARADADGASLVDTLNGVLRRGLAVTKAGRAGRPPFEQKVLSLGEAAFDIDKALSVAAALEDEAVLEKLAGAPRRDPLS